MDTTEILAQVQGIEKKLLSKKGDSQRLLEEMHYLTRKAMNIESRAKTLVPEWQPMPDIYFVPEC